MGPLALIRQARAGTLFGVTDRDKMDGRIYIEWSKVDRHFCGSMRLRKALISKPPVLSIRTEILGVVDVGSA